jgi:hypothetical protein
LVLSKGIRNCTTFTLLHNIGYHIFFLNSQEKQGEVSVTANLGDSPCKIELSSLVPPNGLVSVSQIGEIKEIYTNVNPEICL